MTEKEDELINVKLLPGWFKLGAKVNIEVGDRKGYHGFIKKIAGAEKYDDNITRAKVDVPGVGSFIYKVSSLSKNPDRRY